LDEPDDPFAKPPSEFEGNETGNERPPSDRDEPVDIPAEPISKDPIIAAKQASQAALLKLTALNEQFFNDGSRCWDQMATPGSVSRACGYFRTHRLFNSVGFFTHNMPHAEVYAIAATARMLRLETGPALLRLFRWDAEARDLASEVAFSLKGVDDAKDDDPVVLDIVTRLKNRTWNGLAVSAEVQDVSNASKCHRALTQHMALLPHAELAAWRLAHGSFPHFPEEGGDSEPPEARREWRDKGQVYDHNPMWATYLEQRRRRSLPSRRGPLPSRRGAEERA
jgi:hypothetical protein